MKWLLIMSQWITFGQHASFMDKDDLALFCISSKAKKKKKKNLTNDFERAFTAPKCLDIDKTIAIKKGFKCLSL